MYTRQQRMVLCLVYGKRWNSKCSKGELQSMTIMSHKDCEEWAAMIAQMQDDPSYHPTYNKKGIKVSKDKGPNDLEAIIERLEFRNEKLHQHNEKIEQELIQLRLDNKRLAKQCEEQMQQFRNKGDM